MKLLSSRDGNLLSGANELSLIIYFFVLFTAAVLFSSIPFQLSVLAALMICALLSRSLRLLFPFIKFVVFFMAIVTLFSIVFGPGMGIIAVFGPIIITYSALYFSISMFLRILTSIIALNLLFIAVNPDASVAFFSRFGKKTAAALLVATRLMPMLTSEGEEIMQAFESRGVSIRKGKWRERISAVSHMVFPLVYSTLDRAVYIGEAMEVRGFPARWKQRRYSYSWADYITMGQSISILIYSIVLSLTGPGVADYYSSLSITFSMQCVYFLLLSIPFAAAVRGGIHASNTGSGIQVQLQ